MHDVCIFLPAQLFNCPGLRVRSVCSLRATYDSRVYTNVCIGQVSILSLFNTSTEYYSFTMFDALSPAEVVAAVSRTGATKGYTRLDKTFFSSVFAGSLLAFACGTLLSTNAAAWYQDNAGGLIRTLSSLVFPYGLAMILLTGADLCTSSFLFTTVAALHRKLPWWRMVMHWFVTFWGNLAGSLFVVAIIFGCTSPSPRVYPRDET